MTPSKQNEEEARKVLLDLDTYFGFNTEKNTERLAQALAKAEERGYGKGWSDMQGHSNEAYNEGRAEEAKAHFDSGCEQEA